ncbi:ABC transporter substrate-binding protein [Microbacterium elymi]|uniref:ABC transporter substrate-binding protein n=1 Tax=Microbacterium elymi TaxID=2909587 RepID=A0ABY5NGV8_9MICO|nr:ABC transporter substrate-binding protein [Microbacterium elymi]UUT34438.1 ABC transporter substrate-binding protein [Microbacterium elymi]
MKLHLSGASRRLLLPAVIVAAASIALVGCSGSSSPGTTTAPNANAPGKASDTISWALPPGTVPNWIWPFSPIADFSVTNAEMQSMMYRTLYWFGDNGKTGVDDSLSLANEPAYSNGGKTVTITLKPYVWSNGEKLTAQDVLFWINMDKAEKANYAGYAPGQFPDNIVSAKATNDTTVVLTTDKAYSQQWFLFNQLSQITPMPMAWDETSATAKGDCVTDISGCKAVFAYLTAQSKDLPSYATSKVWSVVDGPWKLKSFNSDGHVDFVPNPTYAGPQKAQVKDFKMVPFTTDTAEFNVLRGGSTLDVGYIPTQDIAKPKPADTSPASPGPNPLNSNYQLLPWFLYGFNYFPINYNNPTVGPIFTQLYFRQALQSVVDQQGIISSTAKNYGVQTTGPVPLFPDSPLVSQTEKDNPYPFSIANAKKYLTDNGWDVVPKGTTTCAKPGTGTGECGAGIAVGQALTFTLPYASGNATIDTAMASLKSNAAQVGITLNLKSEPFNSVTGATVPCSGKTCTWQMGNWGGGWVYAPDFYPTGELLFATGAGSNSGSYSNATLDKLIAATNTQSGTAVLQAYEDFMAKNVPVIYQPNYTYSLTEIANGLKGYTSNNPYGYITPEEWHY